MYANVFHRFFTVHPDVLLNCTCRTPIVNLWISNLAHELNELCSCSTTTIYPNVCVNDEVVTSRILLTYPRLASFEEYRIIKII